jgi:hypothetical protein
MDEYTNYIWSFFLKHKDDQVQIVIKLIKRLQNETQVKVIYICFDNSGENHDIQTIIRDCNPSIKCKFEYTAPDSPQQNGTIERKFATFYGRVRDIINQAEFAAPLRGAMWAYCALHATRLELDNILICWDTHLSLYEMYHQETPS